MQFQSLWYRTTDFLCEFIYWVFWCCHLEGRLLFLKPLSWFLQTCLSLRCLLSFKWVQAKWKSLGS